MNEEILQKESPTVRDMYRHWTEYMRNEVVFWKLEGEFDIHTESHCERVLLLALKIGEQRGMSCKQMVALSHCSIFHDTRRKDNYTDQGHGDRAAEYYLMHCEERGMTFLPAAYVAMKYHDRDDRVGEDYILSEMLPPCAEWDTPEHRLEVYQCFKDADALDRFRLSSWALDVKYLRTKEACGMADYARDLVHATIDKAVLEHMEELLAPFRDRFR